MGNPVILSAARTAIGSLGGTLQSLSASDMGAAVIKDAVRRADIDPESVDQLIMGCVLQAGLGQHPARQCAIKAGLPTTVSALSVNKVCGSGLVAVSLAAQCIRSGDASVVAAGGTESMSQAPYLLDKARYGYRLGDGVLIDSVLRDGLIDAYEGFHMGLAAEQIATRHGIDRAEQDEFALQSQHKCADAVQSGRFNDEIVPISIPQRKGETISFCADEYPRQDCSMESLTRLRPAFKNDGTVTPGNASGINDGAAVIVVSSSDYAARASLKPIAEIVSCASVGVETDELDKGPALAARKALHIAGLDMDSIDLIEINEAFAVQTIASIRLMGCDLGRVNVNGGAIALGHPMGASGTRILVTLIHEMQRRNVQYGLAALCIGGGEGIAIVVRLV